MGWLGWLGSCDPYNTPWQNPFPSRTVLALGVSPPMPPRDPASRTSDDTDDDDNIDPELRLRTVRTAASAIAESILSEQRAERRKTVRNRRSFFRRRHTAKKHEAAASPDAAPSKEIPGLRRKVYVNYPLSPAELGSDGEPKVRYVRNKVRTTSALQLSPFSALRSY